MRVREILDQKGSEVYSVSPESTVYDALKLMAEKNLGALLVKDGDRLAGIFSERDYARKVILKGKFSKETEVSEVMNPGLITVAEDTDIRECMNLFTDKHIRHLPVLRNDKLTGLISIGDVVKAIIHDQEFVIQNLSSYIAG